MFLDEKNEWSLPERPAKPAPRLTAAQERTLARVIGLNLVLLLVAPIGGASLFGAIRAFFG